MGTKEKFWFEHTDGNRWLFKFNRHGHGDDWSERVASEVAGLLGLPRGHVELATFEGRSGVICRDFTRRKELSLVHGNELLVALVDPQYPKGQNYRVTGHTVERVCSILDQKWIGRPEGFGEVEGIVNATDVFSGYLMLDALVGNTDRHHENWAVVLVPANDPPGSVRRYVARLAPTFDHASCLGFNLRDTERIDRMTPGRNRSVESFADRAVSKLYLQVDAPKPLSPLEAFAEATRGRARTRKAWIERLRLIADEQFDQIIAPVPAERMSQAARAFAGALLRLNKARIAGLNP
ncbi:MAG: HipA domain-containing protein [Tepidisphaeraceae bacterium]